MLSQGFTLERSPLTGYTIISAETFDEAEKLAKGCPMIKYVRVYEMAI